MLADPDLCYQALQSRDCRFDGWFFVAVTSTGIYCRPSCPASPPKRANARFYPSAAAAQASGFRACKRCRPDATPGSPEWNMRADLVGRAMRLIGDGVVDREGVSGLARRLGFSARHVHRQLVAEVGAGPVAVARAQRAQTARVLLETTELPISDLAFAAGFASIRQFNDTVREVFAVTPTQLRRNRRPDRAATPGAITVRLPYRAPIDLPALFEFLAARTVPGVEEFTGGVYRRSLTLPHGTAVVELAPAAEPARRGSSPDTGPDTGASTDRPAGPPARRELTGGAGFVQCTLRLANVRDLPVAVQRCRRLLDLDADPVAVATALGADPLLGPLVAASPGRRVPGHVDGTELAVRAVLGQQISVAAARTLAARLVDRYGTELAEPVGAVTRLFPAAGTLATADLTGLGLPASRQRALTAVAGELATGALVLDPGADRAAVRQQLLALPGVGPWTAAYITLRAVGDPDVFLPTDVGVRHALQRLGAAADPRAAAELAERWRPWRSYALLHLWGSLSTEERI